MKIKIRITTKIKKENQKPNNGAIAAGLAMSVFIWGANNTGVKVLVKFWPPITTGCTRFLGAGLLIMALLRWTNWFGRQTPLTKEMKWRLWTRTGVSMAAYIVAFNWALKLTELSHVAIYLGAAPVWALLWEGWPEKTWKSVQSYGAAALAFCGVLILFLPALRNLNGSPLGEVIGLAASILWTNVGRQCRSLAKDLSAMEISGHTFWRAAVLLAPLSIVESATHGKMPLRASLLLIQLFCIVAGSVVAFALWNNGLQHWKTSQVYLFNNLIPLSNMAWAYYYLKEPITARFWVAMFLIALGVILGQANWQLLFGRRWLPFD